MKDTEEKNKFTIDNPMPPLWLMYPNVSRYCIGRRMGIGEDYKFDFWDWYTTLSKEDKHKYQEMFPEPKEWRGIYKEDEVENGLTDEMDSYYYEGVQLWEKGGQAQYTREKLVKENKNNKYFFFWKPDNENVNACFGQWQYSYFIVDTYEYFCAEQYMMAEKARLFEDQKSEELILKSTDPKEMKALGQKVANFNQEVWDKAKYSIVLNGNYYKFAQDRVIRSFIMETKDTILVEASPMDKIWGIGIDENNADAKNPSKWRGSNLLGFALMEVRDEICRVYKNYDKIDWCYFKNHE